MDTTPPGKSTGREIVERPVEAGLGSIPLVGAALAVTFVTALGWRMEQRRERWFTELAEAVKELTTSPAQIIRPSPVQARLLELLGLRLNGCPGIDLPRA
jgi:hypothetical protein